MTRPPVLLVVTVLAALTWLFGPRPAEAAMSGSAAVATSVGTATLQPPGKPATAVTCRGPGRSSIAVAWAASASTFVAGYTVTRSVGGSPPVVVGTTTGTTWTDTNVTASATYTYTSVSTFRSWSTPSLTTTVTTSRGC